MVSGAPEITLSMEKLMQARKLFPVFSPSRPWRCQKFFLYLSVIFLFFTLASPASLFAAGTVLLGSQTIANTPDSNSPGEAEAFQFAATSTGTLNSLTIYIDSASSATQLITGIYSGSGSNPGTLLGQGSLPAPVSDAWNTIALPPVSITSGKVYWIAILGTGGTLKYRDSGSNCISQTSSQSNLTALAAKWSTGSRWNSCTLSAYGSASSSTPVLSLSQSTVPFSATQGSGTNPNPSTVNVTNAGSDTLTFSAASDSPWLSVNPASGTAPQSLQVSATLGGLTAGTYTGHISVSATSAQNSPASITVIFNVAAPTPSPSLSVSPTSLSFSQTQGSLNTLAASSIVVTNAGGGTLTFTASSDSTFLTVSPTSGTAPQSLQVSTAIGSLLPGTYTGHITVSATGVQGSPAVIPVTFIVSPADVAPVISAVSASSITASTAVISWTTDKPGTSQVNFGATSAYGSSSLLDNTLVTTHSATLSGLLPSTLYHYQVQSADAAGSLGGSPDSTFTTSASVVSSCPCTIFSANAVPGTITVNDNQAVELGVRFTSDVSGFITGIRFYKSNSNTGSHTGTLWTASGALLAAATFSGETSSGWQSVAFAAPVPISAGTTYVASYHTDSGFYSADSQFFSNSSVNNPPLHAPAGGANGNGVYVYGSGGSFPKSSWQASNYWVDVVFNTIQSVPTTFSISGTISGGSGATVTLSGAANASTNADPSGNFTFGGLANGAYTVSATKLGATITPAIQAVTVGNANVSGILFTSVVNTYSISGTVAGRGGATVTLSGAENASTTADASGNYSFSGLPNGNYTVTPFQSGTAFIPTSLAVTINNANLAGVSFTAASTTYSISGAINGGGGASITLAGPSSATAIADSFGNFAFTSLINGNYTVSPTKAGFTITPLVQAVTINGASLTSVNFTATVASTTYLLSGTITPASVGSGATVTLSGAASAVTTADAGGNFSFSTVSNGSYTVTPTSSTATFSPATRTVTINLADVTGVAFTGTPTSNVIFFDDFTAPTLDTTKWTALNRAGDYSNDEQECYNPSQVSLDGNNLVITTIAQATTCGDSNHTPGSFPFLSGYIQWTAFNYTYGTLEFRAITAGGEGSWPAVWMLGADCQASNVNSADNIGSCNWPNSGSDEIDVVEMSDNNYISVGHDMFVATGGQACFQNASSDTSQNWHVYTMTWKPGSVTYAIDGTPAGCDHTQNVPSKPMFLIINNAIASQGAGGNWPVVPSTFPQTMQVDYVKVTQP